MKKILFMVALIAAFLSCKKQGTMITYPETRKSNQVDTYFNIAVPDPYNWLENDTSSEVAAWVKAQNAVTNAYLEAIPYREQIKKRLTDLWNYPKYGTPFHEGGNYFYYKNDGLQQQSVLYILKSLDAEPEIFLDPNKLSEDGTVALAGLDFNMDGSLMSYSISKSGSDWNEFFVMDVASKKPLDDHLKWIKFSGMAWYKDGFFYSRFEEPKGSELSVKNQNQKVYYHKIGTKQEQDQLIFEDKSQPEVLWSVQTTEDERFLILSGSSSTNGNSLFFRDLTAKNRNFVAIDTSFKWEYAVVGNIGDILLVKTNNNAPNSRLLAVDVKKPSSENWKDLISEKEFPLEYAGIYGGKIIAGYMKDVVSIAQVFNLEGKKLYDVPMPALGTVGGFSGREEDSIAFFALTSFIYPTTIFKYNIEKNEVSLYRQPEINFDFSKYETMQVFYKSKDGTKIPLFLTYKKGMKQNGKNPVLLYGYGGFNVSVKPSFRISILPFIENGGIYAQANIRGGSEYGEKWHEAGMKGNKQNVFDDFIAAAEYLINEKYTSPEKLAIQGGSNGGLLVGACMIQRPDLFKVALPAVGVMDMLKYHKFTIGYLWVDEYGSSDNEEDFKYIFKYSPLHNLKPGVEYPATLVTTADHDDRVVPAHSFKFIARLQECQKGANPVLIRIEEKAGHSAGKPTSKIIDEHTDILSFLFNNLGIQPDLK